LLKEISATLGFLVLEVGKNFVGAGGEVRREQSVRKIKRDVAELRLYEKCGKTYGFVLTVFAAA
jgi:hypothetical protein